MRTAGPPGFDASLLGGGRVLAEDSEGQGFSKSCHVPTRACFPNRSRSVHGPTWYMAIGTWSQLDESILCLETLELGEKVYLGEHGNYRQETLGLGD